MDLSHIDLNAVLSNIGIALGYIAGAIGVAITAAKYYVDKESKEPMEALKKSLLDLQQKEEEARKVFKEEIHAEFKKNDSEQKKFLEKVQQLLLDNATSRKDVEALQEKFNHIRQHHSGLDTRINDIDKRVFHMEQKGK